MADIRAFAITALHHIDIPEDLGDGFHLHDNMYIVNNRGRVNHLLGSNFRETIGPMEVDSLLDARAVLVEFIAISDRATDDHLVEARLVRFLRRCQQFTLNSWLVKDNAVDFEMGFLEVPHRARPSKVSSNFVAVSCKTADGTEAVASFTKSELALIGRSQAHFGPIISDPATAHVSRVERAIYLVQAARGQSDPSLRIAFYCMSLEALLSNATSELAHKLSERVAWLLGETPEERHDLFLRTKEAYAVRSSVLHGDSVKKSVHSKLTAISIHCDAVLRALLSLLLSRSGLSQEFEKSQEDLEQFLTQLCLGFNIRVK